MGPRARNPARRDGGTAARSFHRRGVAANDHARCRSARWQALERTIDAGNHRGARRLAAAWGRRGGLEESREIAAEALADLLPHRFSYFADDLAVVTWNSALVVDPIPGDTEVQYILEFANAQLLELRCFDARLDRELPKMHERVAGARRGVRALLHRRFATLLGDLQTLVAHSVAIVERVDNSLRITDDVYLARVYSAALEVFRERAWRNGIDRKLGIMRETYAMLNAESQAARGELLEMAIIVLILVEILIGVLR